jgi:hypothetical protein
VIDAQKAEDGGSQQIRRVPAGRQVSSPVFQPRPSRVLPDLTNHANQHASCRPGFGPPEIGQQVPAHSGAAAGGTSVAALARSLRPTRHCQGACRGGRAYPARRSTPRTTAEVRGREGERESFIRNYGP